MNEGRTHFPWATTPSNRHRAEAHVEARPADRVALWAVFLAIFAIIVGASTANASGGGVSAGAPSSSADGGSQGNGGIKHWKRGSATYYNLTGRTACGQSLTSSTIGVANNTLPCGTKVHFSYKGRTVHAKVIDRGGFGCSPNWDLTYGLKRKLKFPGSGKIKYAVDGDRAAC